MIHNNSILGHGFEISTYIYEKRKLILVNKKEINSTKKYGFEMMI